MVPQGDSRRGLPEKGLPTSSVPEVRFLHHPLVLTRPSCTFHHVPGSRKGGGPGMVPAARAAPTFKQLTPGLLERDPGQFHLRGKEAREREATIFNMKKL